MTGTPPRMPLYCNSFIGGEAMRFAAEGSTALDV
jgi:hypothetical protein